MATNILPPADVIAAAALDLAAKHRSYGQDAIARAYDRAAMNISSGIDLLIDDSSADLLVRSATKPSQVYRTSVMDSCSCPSAGFCWHLAARSALVQASIFSTTHTAPQPATTKPTAAQRAKAYAEINELFA